MASSKQPPGRPGFLKRMTVNLAQRAMTGLVFIMPIVGTFMLLGWFYRFIQSWILEPGARAYQRIVQALTASEQFSSLPSWWFSLAVPVLSVILLIVSILALEWFVRSSFFRILDKILNRLPIVAIVYKTLVQLKDAIFSQREFFNYSRVVLIPFPHPSMRSLGMVTNTMKDTTTNKTILCVCVLTGVMPPAGNTLLIPEEEVTDIAWTVNQAIQAIVSGGFTAPKDIGYYSPGRGAVNESGSGPSR